MCVGVRQWAGENKRKVCVQPSWTGLLNLVALTTFFAVQGGCRVPLDCLLKWHWTGHQEGNCQAGRMCTHTPVWSPHLISWGMVFFPSLKSHLDKCLLFHLQHCNLMCLVSVAHTEDGALVRIYGSYTLHNLFILGHLNPLPTAAQHWSNSSRAGSASISHTKALFTSSLSI